MYLTRIELDINKRRTAMALVNPGLIHGAIGYAFDEKERTLWRIDRVDGRLYLLLVSNTIPDCRSIADQFGVPNSYKSIDYTSFLQNIHNGEQRKFRLTANPVITKSRHEGRGRILAHVTTEQQEKWLASKSESNGFLLVTGDYSVTDGKWVRFKKENDGGRFVEFKTATFEGVLTVTDENAFRYMLQNGLGREKAYGCGLMTVTRKYE